MNDAIMSEVCERRPHATDKGSYTYIRVYIYQFLSTSGLAASPLPAHQFARGSACASAARVSTPAAWNRHRFLIESGGTPAPFDPVSRIAHPTASGPAVRANGICSTALTDRACGRAYCVRGVYHCQ